MRVEGRLIVVSNRLPLTLRRAGDGWRMCRSSGGLATSVGPLMKDSGGLWIGCPGEPPPEVEPRRQEHLARWSKRYGYVPVDLPPALARGFYEGFANEVLWPLFHNSPPSAPLGTDGWEAYAEVNHRFRDAVLHHLRPGDRVWIHDYHLMLLPQLLRDAVGDTPIGFFLHTPFPASEIFRIIPRREELLRGLLGSDLMGFQTHGHLQHFRETLLRVLGLESRLDRVQIGRRATLLEALPIGIAPADFTDLLTKHKTVRRALAEQKHRFAGRRVLLAVDRLDYTKGIPQRLRTFRRLLQRCPSLRTAVVLVQVAVPSREVIPRYEQLRHEVSDLVGEINGEFGTPEWTPVVYMRRGLPRAELVALYAAADLAWVTPLCDGMNLVAKEYVACQRGGEGVLVLSEFAGAAAEMGEAFLVNPYDEERTAATVERALQVPASERRQRMAALFRRVERNSVFRWGQRFLQDLDKAAVTRRYRGHEESQDVPMDQLAAAFWRARRRLIALDYDGTLIPFARAPLGEAPPHSIHDLLLRLTAVEGNVVALVSGRPRADIEGWFGDIRGLWLSAEHGALLRVPTSGAWGSLRPAAATEWKSRVVPVLEHFTDRTPGSFVEEKEHSLVWHYRMADPEFGDWIANELVATLEGMLASTELRASLGKKAVEVRPAWANKGSAISHIEELVAPVGFRMAIGDDVTDEDLFEQLPRETWTIHVGDGPTRARFRLEGPADALRSLERLLAGAPRPTDSPRGPHDSPRAPLEGVRDF